MEIKVLNKEYLKDIINLYDNIRNTTYTLWDNGYPDKELIEWDIERKGLYGVFDNEKLVAIAFAGQRNEDNEDNYTWQDTFEKRGTFARIGVAYEYQNKGIGSMLVKYILDTLKQQGFDGVRILVGTQNVNAIKLYKKFGFNNCGETEKYNHSYYLFELRLKAKSDNNKTFDYEEVHKHSTNNKIEIENSKTCGCFYCKSIFKSSEITMWIKDKIPTAICPNCAVDSVIGDASGYPITKKLLDDMNKKWF